MTDWAVLLRGVNVGGAGRLPMADLRAALAGLGLEAPKTLLQSGNAVVGSDLPAEDLAERIGAEIAARFGFRPAVLLRDGAGIAAALAHPFEGARPDQVHAFFLADPGAAVDAAAADRLAATSERWCRGPGLVWLHAPDGIGRSRLAAGLPRLIDCPVTARNLRTVAALDELLRARG